MGLLGDNCSNFLFPLQCDIYYPQESQDEYGAINKKWDFDLTMNCSFHSVTDKSSTKNFSEDSERFYKLDTLLYGRMQKDPRQSSTGLYVPLSNILITNIKNSGCDDGTIFVETDGDYVGDPTIFEIKTCQPYIGPMGNVEYYKMLVARSDIQELYNRVSC
jgi:hypothetical protein